MGLWDLATRRLRDRFDTGDCGGVGALAFEPGGAVLATGGGDGTVRLWDLATHRQIGGPVGANMNESPFRIASALRWVRYGKGGRLVAGDFMGLVQEWDVARPADPAAAVCALVGRDLTRAERVRHLPEKARDLRVCRP
ncbi:hypothetical protein SAMN04489712_107129 [Thermomonospora echinospora]|uniref:Uncharacterized protein n=1 Tax=Thermomonospora echinospora TaxID=1992 RepID=A0A1H6BI37_9ACTN|nr:hypothetical protein [Thermomonospora echinospora]SEG60408.1 hypothetical protein SAMN04489712_107129 [Thermomonospora echinospora]